MARRPASKFPLPARKLKPPAAWPCPYPKLKRPSGHVAERAFLRGFLANLPLFKRGQPAKKDRGVTAEKSKEHLGKDKAARPGAFCRARKRRQRPPGRSVGCGWAARATRLGTRMHKHKPASEGFMAATAARKTTTLPERHGRGRRRRSCHSVHPASPDGPPAGGRCPSPPVGSSSQRLARARVIGSGPGPRLAARAL